MTDIPCKRIWEGAVGITLTPRQQKNGEYFWTFSFVRAYKRKGSEKWEYAQHYAQNHADALGKVLSRAFQFMEQTEPSSFVVESEIPEKNGVDDNLAGAQMPPISESTSA